VNYGRVLRFGLVGVVNTAVYYALYLLASKAVPYLAAHVIAFTLAMIGSYFLNCYVTFQVAPTWRKFLLFPLSNLTNFVVTSVGLYLLVGRLHMNSKLAPLVAAGIAIPITYVVAHLVLVGRDSAAPTEPPATDAVGELSEHGA
jgi:putative flippase GtrA